MGNQSSDNREIWRNIAGNETRYEVFNLGRIQNIDSGIAPARRPHREDYSKLDLKIGRALVTFMCVR